MLYTWKTTKGREWHALFKSSSNNQPDLDEIIPLAKDKFYKQQSSEQIRQLGDIADWFNYRVIKPGPKSMPPKGKSS